MKQDNLDVAIGLIVEADIKNINTINKDKFEFQDERYYEKELLRFLKFWNISTSPSQKNIPIYVICITENIISEKTKEELKKYSNVTYIEKYLPETEHFTSGFWNIPLGGRELENIIKEKYFLRLDLDVQLIKSLPNELINLEDNEVLVGVFDEFKGIPMSKRIPYKGFRYPANTCYTLTETKSGFYKKWFQDLIYIEENQDYFLDAYNLEYDELEEFAFEYTAIKENKKVRYLQKFQIGEGYPPLRHFEDNELNNIYFIHSHIKYDAKDYDETETRMELIRRKRRANDN